MAPSPSERFSALLARSGERGWTPDDRWDRSARADLDDDESYDPDTADDEGLTPDRGTRPLVSRTLVITALGVALTAVLVLLLVPTPLSGSAPLAQAGESWEADHTSAEDSATPEADNGRAADTPGASPSHATTVVVHVVGAVADPGVIELPVGSRVSDAVAASGGATDTADMDSLNLARVVVDGEQIRVPLPGEEAEAAGEPPTGGGSQTGGGAPTVGGPQSATGSEVPPLLDLNTAEAVALETLPGIGPVTAQSIIDHRDAVGRFGSVDELIDVPGIGDATLSRIRDHLTVG